MHFKSLQGIFPVFKPVGITSSQLLEVIKNKLGNETGNPGLIKMGHGGTLDKTAKGVLVVGINSGCSKLPAFLTGEKSYITTCRFGKATDTYNEEGKITMEKPYEHITVAATEEAVLKYVGQIYQKPPPYSALKQQGRRLSDLAREGVAVDPKPRPVHCHKIKILDFKSPSLTLEIVCGRGFYIRSLVHDLGIDLGSCAYVNELERTCQGPFLTKDCLTDHEWTFSCIQEKIRQMEDSLGQYMDIQMSQYRKMQSSLPRKTILDYRKRNLPEKQFQSFQTEQWHYKE